MRAFPSRRWNRLKCNIINNTQNEMKSTKGEKRTNSQSMRGERCVQKDKNVTTAIEIYLFLCLFKARIDNFGYYHLAVLAFYRYGVFTFHKDTWPHAHNIQLYRLQLAHFEHKKAALRTSTPILKEIGRTQSEYYSVEKA